MRSVFIGVLVALSWGLTSAQSNNETLPSCADSCAAGFATPGQFNGCNGQNIACVCSNSTFISNIACCLADKCDASDQAIAAAYARQLCGDNGVTVPTAVSCLTGSTATPTASGSSSNAMAATTATTTASETTSTAASTSKAGAGTNNAGVGAGFVGGLLALLAFLG